MEQEISGREAGHHATQTEGFIGHNHSQLVRIEVSKLSVREGDPRRFKKREIALAKAVLDRLPEGVPLPMVVNARDEVLVGQLFLEAARGLGLKHLVVVRHDGLSKVEEKQYSVAISQLLTKGSWDPASFDNWIREFEESIEDFSHLSIGFDNGELDQVLGISLEADGANQPTEEPLEVDPNPVSRPGVTWLLGKHRIHCGSATSSTDFAGLMNGKIAAMAITDPPFGCKVDGFVSKRGKHRDFVEGAGEMSEAELFEFFTGFAKNLATALTPGALAYVFIDWRSLNLLMRALEPVFGDIVQLCCWAKDRAGMGSFYRSQHELVLVFRQPGARHHNNVQLGRNGRNRSNVWSYPSAASSRSGREGDMLENHPTPKPVEMIGEAILDCTEKGDIVIDCFLGSGTSLIAAERTGRTCYAMDLDPLYVDLAVRRWQKWTGKLAIAETTGLTFEQVASSPSLTDADHV